LTWRLRLTAAFVLVLAVPLGIALMIVDAPLNDELIVFGIATLSGIALGAIVAGGLTKPLLRLAESTGRLAEGDLAVRADPDAPEEIGEVGRAINRLRDRMLEQRANVDASRDEVRESVRRLGEVLRSTHDMRKLLSVVLETSLVAVGAKAGAVYLLSARRSELYVKVGRGLDPTVAQRRIPIGEGLAGWVASRRAGTRLPAGREDAPVPADPEPIGETAIAVALESQSQLLGVLALYGRLAPGPFRDEDLEVITSLADQAGIGIENVLLHQEAQRLSITDGLTGVWNRRYFQMRLPQEFERAIRFGRPLSVLMLDIDHFKEVNDTHGHQRGDSVLVELSQRIVSHTRLQVDTLARYGGEEFVLILPETGAEGARIAAEKIRQEVASAPFDGGAPFDVSISIGYAVYPEHGKTPDELLEAADQAMYAAKARGRDRVVGAEELDQGTSLAPDPARP
jgi:two-component system cell cycle response regulator